MVVLGGLRHRCTPPTHLSAVDKKRHIYKTVRPGFGLGFQVKVLENFNAVSSSLG